MCHAKLLEALLEKGVGCGFNEPARFWLFCWLVLKGRYCFKTLKEGRKTWPGWLFWLLAGPGTLNASPPPKVSPLTLLTRGAKSTQHEPFLVSFQPPLFINQKARSCTQHSPFFFPRVPFCYLHCEFVNPTPTHSGHSTAYYWRLLMNQHTNNSVLEVHKPCANKCDIANWRSLVC